MRAAILSTGFLAAVGAVVITVVHGQINRADDSFSAARKMQGSAFYATGAMPSNTSRYSDTATSPYIPVLPAASVE